jgi:hypothetical protein
LRLLRYERERAGLQREIEDLQSSGASDERMEELGQRKVELSREINRLRIA